MKRSPHQLTAHGLAAAVIATYLVLAVQFPAAYIVGTMEDYFGEWLQFFLFCLTALLAARLALAKTGYRFFFALLALACLYAAMEEISWGQRIFDFGTPDFIRTHNIQNETNIHNFFTGPINTLTKRIIEYAVSAGLLLYGLAYPFALGRNWPPAAWLEGKGLAAPPLYLWPYFAAGAILDPEFFHLNEAEVAEIIIPLGLGIVCLHYWNAHREKADVHTISRWPAALSKKLAGQAALLFLLACLLSTAATYLTYRSPRLFLAAERRFQNVAAKHGEVYRRKELWQTALKLYHAMEERRPASAFVMRSLARCYEKVGCADEAEAYTRKALALDLERLEKTPERTALHLSLVHTYLLLDDRENADMHLEIALRNARRQVEQEPDSASAHYWLGKTSAMMDDYQAAAGQYARACELRPDSIKYRRALDTARRRAAPDTD